MEVKIGLSKVRVKILLEALEIVREAEENAKEELGKEYEGDHYLFEVMEIERELKIGMLIEEFDEWAINKRAELVDSIECAMRDKVNEEEITEEDIETLVGNNIAAMERGIDKYL